MKKALPLSLLILAATLSICQAQEQQAPKETYTIGAGSTFTALSTGETDAEKQLGFYVEGGMKKMLSKNFGYGGSLLFFNQHFDVVTVNSVNMTFNFRYYPIKKFNVIAGFGIGMVTSATTKVKGEKSDIKEIGKGNAMGFAGVGYEFKRFEVSAKFNKIVSDDVVDYTAQLGLSYKL
jgi:hypothetical protein